MSTLSKQERKTFSWSFSISFVEYLPSRSKSLALMNPPMTVAALIFHYDAPYAGLFSESDLVYSVERFVQIRSLLANHDSSPRPVFGQVAVIQGSDEVGLILSRDWHVF
jgi:hypothetical protein